MLNWFRTYGVIFLMLPLVASAQPSYTTNVIADAVVESITDTRVADLDGDGELDIVFCDGGPYDNVSYMDNDGGQWFERLIFDGFGNNPTFDVGDIDSDGHIDLAIAHNAVLVWTRNQGQAENPAFSIDTVSTSVSNGRRPAIADINGDGHPDIAMGVQGNGSVLWFENDGTPNDGGWTEHTLDSNADDVADLSPVDVDGDNDTDLVFADAADNRLGWYENTDGNGTSWTKHTVGSSLSGANYVDAADLDRDGDPDIAVSVNGMDAIHWYENNGDGSAWTAHVLASDLASPYAVTIGDINDDGDMDVVAASAIDNTVVWFDNSTGDFSSFVQRTVAGGNSPEGVDIGDLDGDGDTDAAIGSTLDDDLLFASHDGTPTRSNSIPDSGWRIVGIPYALNNPADGVPGVLFNDDVTESYGVPNWVMTRWDQGTGSYLRFNEFSTQGDMPLIARGYGYWIKHTDGKPVRLDMVTHQYSTNQAPVTLSAALPAHDGNSNGYGIFANPFAGSYDVASMTFTDQELSWAQVIDNGSNDQELNGNVYFWDGGQYVAQSYLTANLDMWEGFWLVRTAGSEGAIDVNFPTATLVNGGRVAPWAGSDKDAEIKTALQQEVAPGSDVADIVFTDFRIGVTTADGQYYDLENRAGFMTGTLPGYDAFDAIELNPPGSPFVQLYFTHPDDAVATRLTNDYRGGRVLNEVWDFDVRTWGLVNEPMELVWDELDDLPQGVKVELSYRDGADVRRPIGYLDELAGHAFTSPSVNGELVEFQLRLVFDDSHSIDADVNLGPNGLPLEYGIARAYPNPFNAVLNLEMALPEAETVSVLVYDITGREVSRVINGPMSAGVHRIAFDGHSLSAGVYVVRMTSRLGVSSQKVVLLK